jgi:RimJ/RimL family protein N-acetyltransferase
VRNALLPRATLAPRSFTFFAAELRPTARFIGMVHTPFAAHFTPCVEIGWRLAAEAWGQGLATEGAHAVLRFGFDELKRPEIVAPSEPVYSEWGSQSWLQPPFQAAPSTRREW